jgi:hypothetical protein
VERLASAARLRARERGHVAGLPADGHDDDECDNEDGENGRYEPPKAPRNAKTCTRVGAPPARC